jgi:hypothetical protein
MIAFPAATRWLQSCWRLLSIALLLCSIPANGAEPVVLAKQTFDDQIPGEHPKGWREKAQPQDAVALIGNRLENPTDCFLLLDRKSGRELKQARPLLKHFKLGDLSRFSALRVSYDIQLRGKGAKHSLELRTSDLKRRLAGVAFGDRYGPTIRAMTGRFKHSTPMGAYRLNQTYRVIVTIPLTSSAETIEFIIQEKQESHWATLKKQALPQEVNPPFKPLGIYLNMPKEGATASLDNLTILGLTTL